MKLLPLSILLSCSLVFAQTPPTVGKVAPKTEVKTKDMAKTKVGEVVANKESKVFHEPSCKMAAKIKVENKVTLASKADAATGGYKACKICKP